VSRTRSLRVQLTATFVAVGAMLVAAGYGGAAWLLHRAVWSPLDAALRAEATALALIRETDDAGEASDGERGEGIDDMAVAAARLGAKRNLGAGKFVTITSAAEGVIASSGQPPTHIPSTDGAPITERARFIPDGAQLYRAVTHRIPGFGSITVGVQADSYVRLLHGALTVLGAGALSMLGAIGLLAWAITTRATKEIDALTTMNIPPERMLVLPRLAAITIMMPVLAIIANLSLSGKGGDDCLGYTAIATRKP